MYLHTDQVEQLGKSVYNALELCTGNFVLVHEWVLQWQKKMGKFLTSQEKEKIEKCKKQVTTSLGFFPPPNTFLSCLSSVYGLPLIVFPL